MKQNRRICFLCRAADEFGQSQFSARRAQNREKPTGIFTLRRATAEFDEKNFRNALWRLVENLGSIKKKQGECEGGVPALVKFFYLLLLGLCYSFDMFANKKEL